MTSSLVGNSFFGLDLSKIKASFAQFRRFASKRVLLIEFGISSVNFAEVQVRNGAISLDHIRRYSLPEDALERGIPNDPAQMAALIKGHCLEEKIPAHRAAVVIPPDAAFTTLVQLPEAVAAEDAVAYAMDPASSVQIPIQLDQTDAELIPLNLPSQIPGQRSYFLTAVPCKLVDRLLETINLADLELLKLQIGTFAQLSQQAEAMGSLATGELILHVELLRECSLVTLVAGTGPIKLSRLTAIREFPEPEEGSVDVEPSQLLSTERQIVASDRYMPLSDLDLRRLVQELKQTMADAQLQFPWLRWKRLVLAGPNSAHPLLADLLQEAMGLSVELCRPLASGAVGLVELKQPILMQRLGRLVGLGLSFLESTVPSAETFVPVLELPERLAVALVEEPQPNPELNVEPELILNLSATEPESAAELDPMPQPDIAQLAIVEPTNADEEPSKPRFSFADLDEAEWPTAAAPVAPVAPAAPTPEPIEAVTAEEETPFSMGDLLSSFEARQDSEPEQTLSEQDTAEVYLIDDPSLWPSVAKDAIKDKSGPAEEEESSTS